MTLLFYTPMNIIPTLNALKLYVTNIYLVKIIFFSKFLNVIILLPCDIYHYYWVLSYIDFCI